MYKHYRSILATVLLFGIAAAFLLFQGCKKQDKATPSNNNDSGAKLFEYAGVIVGSSGYYKVEVDTNGATAFVIFDDHEHRLSVLKKIEKGKDIDSLVMKDDEVTVVYSYVYATLTPYVSITIKGHDVEYTVHTLYDYRHPQYAQDENRIRLYEGTNHTTGVDNYFVNAIYNMSFDTDNNTFEGITKVTASSIPEWVGKVWTYSGTYTETATTLTITVPDEDGNNDSFELKKQGNDLIYEGNYGDYYTSMYLKYVSF